VLRALSYIKIKVEDKLIVDDCGLLWRGAVNNLNNWRSEFEISAAQRRHFLLAPGFSRRSARTLL
jgi:hypothetical protein